MLTKTWEQHTETFDKVYALRREYFLGPALKSFLGDVRGKSVIDLGCGAGHFTDMCAKRGATAIGIDASSNMVNMAAKNYLNIPFIHGDAVDLEKYIRRKVDIVFASQVFLTISSRLKIQRIFRQVSDILKKGGIFIFIDVHFFRRDQMHDNFLDLDFPKNFSYFKSGIKYSVTLKSEDGKVKMNFKDIFWNLSDYISFVKAGGFMIEDILEPKPVRNIPKQYRKFFRQYFENPLYIFFKVRKM